MTSQHLFWIFMHNSTRQYPAVRKAVIISLALGYLLLPAAGHSQSMKQPDGSPPLPADDLKKALSLVAGYSANRLPLAANHTLYLQGV